MANVLVIFDGCIYILVFFLSSNFKRYSITAESNSCNLPKECKLIKPYLNLFQIYYIIKCNLAFNIDLELIEENEMKKCDIYNDTRLKAVFYPENPFSTNILDKNFNFDNLKNYIRKFPVLTNVDIKYFYLQGIQLLDMISYSNFQIVDNTIEMSKVKFLK